MNEHEIVFNLERILKFQKNDEEYTGIMRISKLGRVTHNKWECFWSIEYLCVDGKVYGEDALQALTNALRVMSMLISAAEADGIKVWWQYEGDNGGLAYVSRIPKS